MGDNGALEGDNRPAFGQDLLEGGSQYQKLFHKENYITGFLAKVPNRNRRYFPILLLAGERSTD